ncbi:MAG: glycosyltransferase [Planctomycetota bacterium]
MKILLVSAFIENHPVLKPGQYLQKDGEGLMAAFQNLGHAVDAFDYRTVAAALAPSPHRERFLRRWTRRMRYWGLPFGLRRLYFRVPGIHAMNRTLAVRAAGGAYDLVVLTKAELVEPDTIRDISRHTPTWFFYMDPLAKARLQSIHEQAAAATRASATRTNAMEFFNAAGARAEFLPEGADTAVFYPDPAAPQTHDVVFVGTVNRWRRKYIDHCREHGVRIETFGKGGKNPFISGKDIGDLYRTSRIVLDFHNTGGNTGFSLRVFEVLGAGAFLLSEYSRDTAQVFDIGREVVCFKTPEELVALIRKHLGDEAGRRMIAQAGAARVARDYTWDAVARRITATIAP